MQPSKAVLDVLVAFFFCVAAIACLFYLFLLLTEKFIRVFACSNQTNLFALD